MGVIGLVANITAVWVLSSSRNHNLNLRAAFLEVVNDALGSVAVIISALVIGATGWTQADALAGILISLLIVPRAVAILRHAGSVRQGGGQKERRYDQSDRCTNHLSLLLDLSLRSSTRRDDWERRLSGHDHAE